MWNTIGILWYNLMLILQSQCAEPLFFPVIWQWSLTLYHYQDKHYQIQHLVGFSKSSSASLGITNLLLKCFFIMSLQHLLSAAILLIKIFKWYPQLKRVSHINTSRVVAITASNMFLIFVCVRLFWILLPMIFLY